MKIQFPIKISSPVWSKIIRSHSESDQTSSTIDRSSLQHYGIEAPRVDFKTAWEMYRTIPKFQNTVESSVLDIVSRDWYYESKDESKSKLMDDWEEKYNASDIFESMIRQWEITGNHLLGYSDWKPVQMQTVIGVKREKDGTPIKYIQQFSNSISINSDEGLDASKFCHSKYIEADREAWGLGLYHSLLETWTTDKNKESKSLAWIHRDVLQMMYKILKKFSSPKVIWGFDNIDKDTFEKDISPLLASMEEGDSLALSKVPQVTSDTLDGKGRFYEYINDLSKNVDTGLQSSANRLITEPSAMADAREANKKDDSRVLGIMEKIRRLMNDVIIPKVVGEKGVVEFKWGTKDTLELEFPQSLRDALQTNVINAKIARHILVERLRWDIPEDLLKEMEQNDIQRQKSQDNTQVGFDPNNPSEPNKNDKQRQELYEERMKTYRKIQEAIDRDQRTSDKK